MSTELGIYNEELEKILTLLADKIQTLKTADPKNTTIHGVLNDEINDNLKKGDEALKLFELEARASDLATKNIYLPKARQYKEEIAKVRTQQRDANFQLERNNLVGGGSAGVKSSEDRSRMMDIREKTNQQTEKIERLTRIVNETEEVGSEITNELANNRERIVASKEKATEVKGIANNAEKSIKRMYKREWSMGFF